MKLLQLFLCCALFQYAAAKLTHSQLVTKFNQLTESNHQTLHSSADLRAHFLEFKTTANFIENHNALHGQNWKADYNEFSTMTAAEKEARTGINVSAVDFGRNTKVAKRSVDITKRNPTSLDYTEYLPYVKQQGQCGSCWSFPSTAAIEYILNKDSGEIASLSEQMYVDCTYGAAGGCSGGWMHKAWEWTTANGQMLASQEDYPYRGNDDMDCYAADVESAISGYAITGHVWLERGEDALETALVEIGVITAVVGAVRGFFSYRSGIFTGVDGCENYNHAVTIVGYGEEGGVGYWMMRNSWGDWWGEVGSMRIQRGLDGYSCAIEKHGLYPLVTRSDDENNNNNEEEEEEEEEEEDVHWCQYEDKYLAGYAGGGTNKFNTLEEAKSKCLERSSCNGVTYETRSSKYSLRRGTTLKRSGSSEISWKVCEEV